MGSRWRAQASITHDPDFPVEEGVSDEPVLVFTTAPVVVQEQSRLDGLALLGGEELGSSGVVAHHPDRDDTDDDGEDTLENEDPLLGGKSVSQGSMYMIP